MSCGGRREVILDGICRVRGEILLTNETKTRNKGSK